MGRQLSNTRFSDHEQTPIRLYCVIYFIRAQRTIFRHSCVSNNFLLPFPFVIPTSFRTFGGFVRFHVVSTLRYCDLRPYARVLTEK